MEETKRRVPFTDIERQKLRMQHRNFPSLAQQGLIAWFEQEFGRQVSLSSVSEILSFKYSHLDNVNMAVTTRKKGGSQWAELEGALFRHWRDLQPRNITLAELRAKAIEIWEKMPTMQERKKPSFSDGWLVKWKTRHEIPVGLSTHLTPIHVGQNFKRRSDDAAELKGLHHAGIRHCEKRQRVLEVPAVNRETRVIQAPSGLANPNFAHYQDPREPIAPEPVSWFNQMSSTNIQSILRNHGLRGRNGDASFLSDRIIHRYFGSILDPSSLSPILHYRNGDKWFRESLEMNFSRYGEAVGLLMTSKVFELERTPLGSPDSTYEDWFLDYVNPDKIRSPSPGLWVMEAGSEDSAKPESGVKNRRMRTSLQISSAAMVSTLYKGARIEFFTKTYKQVKTAATNQETDFTESRITITPPITSPSAMQAIFHSTSQTCGHFRTLITPTISFRNVRSENATIFKIARAGTARALEMAFARGEGSLSDCDQGGRSLLNVSHILRHPSKTYMWTACASWLKYLCARISSASYSRC
jgi:hypothetical protein